MEEEWISGKHAVLEALRAGRSINKIWIYDQAGKHHIRPIIAAAKQAGVIVQFADKRKLDQMAAGIQHQGIVAQAAAYGYIELDELLAQAASAPNPPFFVILDEIEDPHNLGSILRTADCAGVSGIIIPKRRSVGLTATVAKTSAGAIEYIPVARVSNIPQTIDRLKEHGIWIIGADAAAEQTVYDVDLTIPLALVIGSEHKGIGRLIGQKCDFLVKLPMLGHIQSLNASVAAGLLMYEIVRQRDQGR